MLPAFHKWTLFLHIFLAFGGVAIISCNTETGPGGGGGGVAAAPAGDVEGGGVYCALYNRETSPPPEGGRGGGGGEVRDEEEGEGTTEAAIDMTYPSSSSSNASSSSSSSSSPTSSSNTTVKCGTTDKCFSYWKYVTDDQNVTTIQWILRGCWDLEKSCNQASCVATDKSVNDTFFCCCTGDLCNTNVEARPTSSQAPNPGHEEEEPNDTFVVVWVMSGLAFIILVGCCTAVAFRYKKVHPPTHPVPVEEAPNSPRVDMDSLKFMETIGQGRYGTAYRAVVGGDVVAVKLFPPHYKSSYINEKYIYSLPLMEHPNLLSFLGGDEFIGPDGCSCYGIVLSYCPRGRLSNYLAENTLNWATFCQIVLSATRGLSHLHSEIRKCDLSKPCVCHRDFNTRNLLLTENMSCVVSDLGFAIHTQGSKYYINGEEQHAETSSLTDVGTLRYMAPEVLEGAVNLRDCEAALKQIDIYALGLVLWECAARCHDLYQGLQPPPYMLPFQAEIGLHPSFEQMQVLVVRNKARPLFHPVWKDTNPAIRSLKETIEDCWDHDAEARLSSMCVEGRLSELPTLWERYKSSLGVSGVSPTINPMSQMVVTQRQSEMFSGLMGNGGKVISNALTPRDKESSVSEATVETTVPSSPSAPALEHFLGKNQLLGTLQPPMPPLQPHQGRNPCMERNLVREVPQDLSVSGNTLIDNLKENGVNSLNTINSVNFMDSLDVQHALEANGFVNEQLMPLLNGHSNQTASVVPQRQALPPPTLVPPIPYVQNEVRSIDNQPKKQNTAVQEENQDTGLNTGRGSSWRRWRNTLEDRLKSLIPRRHHHNTEDEERQEILVTPTSSSLSEPPTPLAPTQSVPVVSPQMPVQTEVLLTNGGLHTVISPNHTLNTHHSSLPGYVSETEIGIAKLHMQNGFAPVIRSRQGSKDSGLNKSSENNVSFVDSDNSCEKLKRPTTLSLPEKSQEAVGNSDHKENERQQQHPAPVVNMEADQKIQKQQQQEQQQRQEEERIPSENNPVPETEEVSPPLRKAKQRVKTPRRPMNPRLSLYDDRIMGCSEVSEGSGRGECKLEESLSHSLPIHMDTLEQHQQPFLSKPVIRTIATSQNFGSASLRRHPKVPSTSNKDSQGNHSSSHGSLTHDYHHRHPQHQIRASGDVL